jgi:hypothetical protein
MKVFFREVRRVDPSAVIAMMQRWIREALLPGLPIDVVDYRHVADGPAVLLIAHGEQIAVEWHCGEPGLRYASRGPASLDELLGLAVQAARLVEESAEIGGAWQLVLDRLELGIRDRLRTPRRSRTFERLYPELRDHFMGVFGGEVHLFHAGDAPFTVRVRGGPEF